MSGQCRCYPGEKDGYEFVQWVGSYLSDCVYTPIEIVACLIGMSSILFWIACQLPQFIKNYQRGSADALSFWFLLEWLTGDTFNLTGCILTHQLPTQLYTAYLFAFQDTCMLSQYLYYTCRGRCRREKALSKVVNHKGEREPLLALALPIVAGVVSVWGVSVWHSGAAEGAAMAGGTLHTGRVLLSAGSGSSSGSSAGQPTDSCIYHAPVPAWAHETGVIMGWVSSVLYLNSRLPQIYKNFKRGTCDGLSWKMFFCAFMGNVTYVLGIVLRTRGHDNWMAVMPWLPGSAGTLFLDLVILVQYFTYNVRRAKQKAKRRHKDVGVLESLTRTPTLRKSVPRGLHNIVAWTQSPATGDLYETSPSASPYTPVDSDVLSDGGVAPLGPPLSRRVTEPAQP